MTALSALRQVVLKPLVAAGVASPLWTDTAVPFMALNSVALVVLSAREQFISMLTHELGSLTQETTRRLQQSLRPLLLPSLDWNLVTQTPRFAAEGSQLWDLVGAVAPDFMAAVNRATDLFYSWLQQLPQAPTADQAICAKASVLFVAISDWESNGKVNLTLFFFIFSFFKLCMVLQKFVNTAIIVDTWLDATLRAFVHTSVGQFISAMEKGAAAYFGVPQTPTPQQVQPGASADQVQRSMFDSAQSVFGQRDVTSREVGVVVNMAIDWAHQDHIGKMLPVASNLLLQKQAAVDALRGSLSRHLWLSERLIATQERIDLATFGRMVPPQNLWMLDPSSVRVSLIQSLSSDVEALNRLLAGWKAHATRARLVDEQTTEVSFVCLVNKHYFPLKRCFVKSSPPTPR